MSEIVVLTAGKLTAHVQEYIWEHEAKSQRCRVSEWLLTLVGNCVIVSASTASSSHESCEYETARMNEVQIKVAAEMSREQGWSELTHGDQASSSSHDEDTRDIWNELTRSYPSAVQADVGERLELGRLRREAKPASTRPSSIMLLRGNGKLSISMWRRCTKWKANLQRQWPRATKDPYELDPRVRKWGALVLNEYLGCNCSSANLGTFLKDGRFAFLMIRRWGDLRTFMNLKLNDSNDQGPPFSHPQALKIMQHIASCMVWLHAVGV